MLGHYDYRPTIEMPFEWLFAGGPIMMARFKCYFDSLSHQKVNKRAIVALNHSPVRARKLYTSARIYEWKFGKGEWKLPFASLTGRVDFFVL